MKEKKKVFKGIKVSTDSSMLFAGYSIRLIEVYSIDVSNHTNKMIYDLILDKADFVYQMQILNDNKLYVIKGIFCDTIYLLINLKFFFFNKWLLFFYGKRNRSS